jgi:hypothetical protein
MIFLLLAMLQVWQIAPAFAQSLTSGDIAGTITDPSGAVVPNAAITLKSSESGVKQTKTTNQQGAYRFSLLRGFRHATPKPVLRSEVLRHRFQRDEELPDSEVGVG